MTRAETRRRAAEWRRLAQSECPNRAVREVMLENLTWNEYNRTVKSFGLAGGEPMTLRAIADEERINHKTAQESIDRALTKLKKNSYLWLRWLMLNGADPEGDDLRLEASDLRQLSTRGVLRPSGTKWASDSERNG